MAGSELILIFLSIAVQEYQASPLLAPLEGAVLQEEAVESLFLEKPVLLEHQELSDFLSTSHLRIIVTYKILAEDKLWSFHVTSSEFERDRMNGERRTVKGAHYSYLESGGNFADFHYVGRHWDPEELVFCLAYAMKGIKETMAIARQEKGGVIKSKGLFDFDLDKVKNRILLVSAYYAPLLFLQGFHFVIAQGGILALQALKFTPSTYAMSL